MLGSFNVRELTSQPGVAEPSLHLVMDLGAFHWQMKYWCGGWPTLCLLILVSVSSHAVCAIL